MRHGTIKTTMDYDANVDDAVLEAGSGPKRNTQRNTQSGKESPARASNDAKPDSATTCGR
jgi:hypothetical protein